MWILEKPLIDEALSDIARVIAESNASLTGTDGTNLNSLYRLYDRQGGTISKQQDETLSASARNTLYNLYDKTQEGRRLSYIRTQLFKAVDVCPMCGIQPPSQLDHQMPRSKYKSLSVCRLNLVPLCGVCNNKKKASDASTFVHPYYDHELQDLPFFIIDVHSSPVTHRLSWKFSINEQVVGNPTLAAKIRTQVGVVKLFRRLYKETNNLLSDLLFDAEDWNEETFKFVMQREYRKHLCRRGTNDWHTVFIKALLDSPRFSLQEAKVYAQRITPVNQGLNG